MWTTATNFYPGNGQPENLYAKFVHKGMSGSNPVFINGLAYRHSVGHDDYPSH